jgi:hypothetical protein
MTLFTEPGMDDLKAFFPWHKLAQGNQSGRNRRLAFRPRTSRRRGFHEQPVRRVVILALVKPQRVKLALKIGKANIGGKVSKANSDRLSPIYLN